MSLAIKRVTVDRKTGTVTNKEIIDNNPDIEESEVYSPFSKMVYDKIMSQEVNN
jgi:hypothetical protein